MHMGRVELTVSDLGRSLEYWQGTIGLQVLERNGGTASLGPVSSDSGSELVRLVEEPGAQPARGYAGLFHVALLVPARRDLARWLAHAAQSRTPLEGLSDHAVSEAIYLRDPDQHGIEIYADRPREQWDGRVMELMTTLPLDVDSLFEDLDEPRVELPAGTVVGHTHLCVAEVDSTVAFYRDVLGFELMAQLGPMAAFLSRNGYHHHVGANTWESRGAPAAPAGTARLLSAAIVLDGEADLDAVAERAGTEVVDGTLAVHDPSGNRLLLTAA
jgi:catechol 2,3-dioxygenase